MVRKFELPAAQEPRVIGLDDWAWKRRHRYGTLICDLEQGRPLDLLPDRRAETVSAWLQAHPHIDTVSRDGSSQYASAIKKGAPQARQVSDRWHLTKNLAEGVSVLLAQSLGRLRRAEQARVKTSQEGQSPHEQHHPLKTRAIQQVPLARQAERMARYEQIRVLQKQGMKSADIAAQIGMAERTVRRWLSRGDIPSSGPRRERAHLIDSYKTHLAQRWQQGCHNGLQLERERRAQGYKGSRRGVSRYLATLEPSPFSPSKRSSASPMRPTAIQPNPLLTLSVPQATWLFFRKEADLKEEEQEKLRQLRQTIPQVEVAYQLVETFLQMVRERTGEQLDTWLSAVEASHLEAFEPFVTGVQKDKDAVLAALTLPWSNDYVA